MQNKHFTLHMAINKGNLNNMFMRKSIVQSSGCLVIVREDVIKIERVLKRFTRMLPVHEVLSYESSG